MSESCSRNPDLSAIQERMSGMNGIIEICPWIFSSSYVNLMNDSLADLGIPLVTVPSFREIPNQRLVELLLLLYTAIEHLQTYEDDIRIASANKIADLIETYYRDVFSANEGDTSLLAVEIYAKSVHFKLFQNDVKLTGFDYIRGALTRGEKLGGKRKNTRMRGGDHTLIKDLLTTVLPYVAGCAITYLGINTYFDRQDARAEKETLKKEQKEKEEKAAEKAAAEKLAADNLIKLADAFGLKVPGKSIGNELAILQENKEVAQIEAQAKLAEIAVKAHADMAVAEDALKGQMVVTISDFAKAIADAVKEIQLDQDHVDKLMENCDKLASRGVPGKENANQCIVDGLANMAIGVELARDTIKDLRDKLDNLSGDLAAAAAAPRKDFVMPPLGNLQLGPPPPENQQRGYKVEVIPDQFSLGAPTGQGAVGAPTGQQFLPKPPVKGGARNKMRSAKKRKTKKSLKRRRSNTRRR